MRKLAHFFTFTLLLFLFVSCGSTKKAVEKGNYDQAITDASLALKKNKNNQKQALILEEAYKKATEQDLQLVKTLKTKASDDPVAWTAVYDIYDRMLIREIAIMPLLPLEADGRQLQFDMPNVDEEAEQAKTLASSALYVKALELLNKGDKQSARQAYALLNQLVEFNYGYEDAKQKRDEAKIKGSTNVFVTMKNDTGRALPATFEDDLLTFREGAFSDPWVLYHIKKQANVNYDYTVDLDITKLLVGRDSEQSRNFREQQQVIVGYKEVKNSKGETVQQPQYGTVYADVYEVLQTKPISVAGTVIYKDKTGKQVASIPVQRDEAWQNNYAQFRGDQRALSQETIAKIQNGQKPFPTDQQLYEVSGKLLNQAVINLFEQNAKNLQ